jgi:hypothetical protein
MGNICVWFGRNATEIGWLEVIKDQKTKEGEEKPQWQRRWFELKDGVIRHAASDQPKDLADSVCIPIENIIRLVTGNKQNRRRPSWKLPDNLLEGGDGEPAPQHLITMKTTHEKLILRAESIDDLNRLVILLLFLTVNMFQKGFSIPLDRDDT